MSVQLSDEQLALLGRMRNGTLGPVGAAGGPHLGPVWYFWDGAAIRISTPAWTRKVADITADARVALCIDDQVAGDYLTMYGTAAIVDDERVTELTEPLLLAYLHQGVRGLTQIDPGIQNAQHIDFGRHRLAMLMTPLPGWFTPGVT